MKLKPKTFAYVRTLVSEDGSVYFKVIPQRLCIEKYDLNGYLDMYPLHIEKGIKHETKKLKMFKEVLANKDYINGVINEFLETMKINPLIQAQRLLIRIKNTKVEIKLTRKPKHIDMQLDYSREPFVGAWITGKNLRKLWKDFKESMERTQRRLDDLKALLEAKKKYKLKFV